ncbi:MAG: M23 family metallopeptidase [Candidatus Abawacabacteria bacterium]|nr:M23 family metallopeptidase [Candidatus Abawacabacteria bacterium]
MSIMTINPTIKELVKLYQIYLQTKANTDKALNDLTFAICKLETAPDNEATIKETIKLFNVLDVALDNNNAIYNSVEYAIMQLGKKFKPSIQNKNSMIWPMEGVKGSLFGEKRRNSKGQVYYHTGQDIKNVPATDKTPIVAAAMGTVIFADMGTNTNHHNGYGYCVDINHGCGLVTRYGHCSVLFVKTGDKVIPGQKIAIVGSTGHSTGPHLHWEVIVDGKPVNPLPYLPSR